MKDALLNRCYLPFRLISFIDLKNTISDFFLQTCCLLIFSCYFFHTHSTGVTVLSIWIYSQCTASVFRNSSSFIKCWNKCKKYCPMVFEKAFSVNGTTGLNLYCSYKGRKYLTNKCIFRLIHNVKKAKCSKFNVNFIPPPRRNDVGQSLFSHSSSTGESLRTRIIWATCCSISAS